MHIIVQPITWVHPTVCPEIHSLWLFSRIDSKNTKHKKLSISLSLLNEISSYLPAYFIIIPFSVIFRTISPCVCSFILFLTIHIVSFIFWSIIPSFNSFTMLQVIFPLAFISSSIHVNVRTLSISFIPLPFSFEDITINMIELTLSMSFIVLPFTWENTKEFKMRIIISESIIKTQHIPSYLAPSSHFCSP